MCLCFDRSNRLFGTDLLTNSATGAHGSVDDRLFPICLNGRTAYQQTDAALIAFLSIHRLYCTVFRHVDGAGAAYDNHGKLMTIKCIFKGGSDIFKIKGINHRQVFHTDTFDHIFQDDFTDGLSLHGDTRTGVFLVLSKMTTVIVL